MVDVHELARQTNIFIEPQDWFRATWRDVDPLPCPDVVEPAKDFRGTVLSLSPEELIQQSIERESQEFTAYFTQHMLPYLSREKRKSLQRLVADHIARTPQSKPTQYGGGTFTPVAYRFAAFLGLHAPVEALITSWPDFKFGKNAYRNQEYEQHSLYDLIMGPGDPQKMLFHMRRLNLPLRVPQAIRAWLANTELSGLDMIQQCILAQTSPRRSEELVRALGCAVSPVVAPLMLEIMVSSRGGAVAKDWLDMHPHESLTGLIPLAEGRGKTAELAQSYLKGLIHAGKGNLIEQYADARLRARLFGKTPNQETPAFDDTNSPDWLKTHTKAIHRFSQADIERTLDLDRLPSLIIENRAFNETQIEAVILMFLLSQSKNAKAKETALEFAAALKTHGTALNLDQFAWAIVDGWITAGTPPRERWMLNSIKLLGSDQVVSRLYTVVREWAAQKKTSMVRIGLECMALIGSDVALTQLFRLEQILPIKSYRVQARKQINNILTVRNMTEDQLGDRIVPDCGLDADGNHTFDYGTRRFHFLMNNELIPMIREENGTQHKPRPDLPKPTTRDDAEKAEFAQNEWKLIKKQIRDTAKVQALRLERALVDQRRWTWEEFNKFFLSHPFMRHFAQSFVWGCYAPELAASFRLNHDYAFTDAHDHSIEPDQNAQIGLVHPIQLADAERSAWGELFADYEIIPPFSQIGREIFRLTPGEQDAKVLTRFEGRQVHIIAFHNNFVKLGWSENYSLRRLYPGANLTAVLYSDASGQNDGYVDFQEIRFHAGLLDKYIPYNTPFVPPKEVPPLIISEILRDLSLVFKA